MSWSEIPTVPWGDAIRSARHMRRDMLGVVSERYEKLGPVVRQAQGPVRMVNLFGPEATRMLLLDRERIFSAKKSWDLIMGGARQVSCLGVLTGPNNRPVLRRTHTGSARLRA